MKFAAIFAVVVAIALAENYAIVYGTKDNWGNYSIQSEPCRQYALLRQAGFPPENIILMAYSSVKDSSKNPFPGMIFTDPAEDLEGDWAKYGCFENIDYTDKEINRPVFMALLAQDKEALKKATGRDDVRVLPSGPEDNLFMYFIDHGSDNIIAVGNDVVSDKDVLESLKTLYQTKKYKKLVWYMEACHSGSMFTNLPDDWNIYVMTSSDAHHNAYMSNCPPMDKVAGKNLGTCIAGLWDNYYMEEYTKDASATIGEIFTRTHDRVALENSQNVSEFGDFSMHPEKLSDYVGVPTMKYTAAKDTVAVDYYEVPRHLALWRAIRAETEVERKEALAELATESMRMAKEEVDGMRLGRIVMEEKAVHKVASITPEQFEYNCFQSLAMDMIQKCGHSTPLNPKVSNILKSICLPGLRAPNVDFSQVC